MKDIEGPYAYLLESFSLGFREFFELREFMLGDKSTVPVF